MGSLDLDRTREFAFCQYCGTKIMIQEEIEKQHVVIDDSKKIAGWIESAKLFLNTSNKAECYRYASMAADADPNNVDAWYLKTKSAPAADLQMVAATRVMDLVEETDPYYNECKGIRENASNQVKVTIVRMARTVCGAYAITVYFDEKVVVFNSADTAVFYVTKNTSHIIKASCTIGRGTEKFSPSKDVTYTITSGIWCPKVKLG